MVFLGQILPGFKGEVSLLSHLQFGCLPVILFSGLGALKKGGLNDIEGVSFEKGGL